MAEIEPFPLIDLEGPPRQRGRAHGEQAAERVRRGADLYRGRLARAGLDRAAASEAIGRYLPVMEDFGAHLVEEMRGIAEGAGVAFEDVALLNARTEIVAEALKSRADEPDGCTGVAVLPGRSASGRLIHAQNWDWLADCAGTAVVLRIARDDGPDILTFTEAGGLARSGLNAAGIAITANYLESDRDYRGRGVPLALIRRKVLEQEHFAAAIRIVATTPKACSNNMILSHAGGVAIDLECAPDEAFPLYPEAGLLVHANHWLSPVALSKLKEAGLADSPDSLYRDIRARSLLEAPKLSTADVKAALADRFGWPYSVCRPPAALDDEPPSATVATLLLDPGAGTMEIAPLPALGGAFTAYGLTGAGRAARLAAAPA